MQRREFLKTAAMGAAAALTCRSLKAAPESEASNLARKMPRWRGFNLLEKFQVNYDRPGIKLDSEWVDILKYFNIPQNAPFFESDFQWIADWGFDFVRLPMDYRCWTDAADPYRFHEQVLADIDQAVEFGRKYGVHVCLNLHRAPGYTVSRPPEVLNLWADEEAQKQFDFQWTSFAQRYRGIPSKQLSFNLVNEPAGVAADICAKVVRRATAAIRRVDPERLIIADGLQCARQPIFDLADLGIAQSTRGYSPMQITHYQASWVNSKDWKKPTWPLIDNGKTIDRQRLLKDCIEPWKKLEAAGVGVHAGEWGAYNKTPHDAVLPWARDCLDLWKEAGWGWALWNLRGPFGIVDSDRADVDYEDFHDHKLDRKMLTLLQAS